MSHGSDGLIARSPSLLEQAGRLIIYTIEKTMAVRIHRVTMFKLPDPEDQKKLIEAYKTLSQKQQKVIDNSRSETMSVPFTFPALQALTYQCPAFLIRQFATYSRDSARIDAPQRLAPFHPCTKGS